mgnify:CR=1 FL=1
MKKQIFSLLSLLAIGAASAEAVTVTAPEVEAVPGETVSFAISMSEGRADSYISLDAKVQFPATGFTTTRSYTLSSLWTGASTVIGDIDSDGLLTFGISSANKIAGTALDDIITVEFEVDESLSVGTYDVTLKDMTFGYNFSDKDVAADYTFQVNVVSVHSVTLDENSTTAPAASNAAVNVTVKRTIAAGNWNTIVLPFDMTEAQVKAAFGNDVQLGDFTGYSYDSGADKITVNFDSVSAIAANHPYIIKVSEAVSQFTVEGVTIDPEDEPCNEKTTKDGRNIIIEWGIYGTYVNETNIPYDPEHKEYNLFLSENKFYYATSNTKAMKAFRAYFYFKDVLTSVENAASRVRMSFGDAPDGIADVQHPTYSEQRVYNLQGQPVKHLGRGIYVKGNQKIINK